jgi:hypothetical protein
LQGQRPRIPRKPNPRSRGPSLIVPKDDFKLLLACSRQLSHSPVSCPGPPGTGTGRSVRSQALPFGLPGPADKSPKLSAAPWRCCTGCRTAVRRMSNHPTVHASDPRRSIHASSSHGLDSRCSGGRAHCPAHPTRVAIALHCQSSCDDDNHYTGLHGCRLESLLHGPCEMAHAIFTQSRQT